MNLKLEKSVCATDDQKSVGYYLTTMSRGIKEIIIPESAIKEQTDRHNPSESLSLKYSFSTKEKKTEYVSGRDMTITMNS